MATLGPDVPCSFPGGQPGGYYARHKKTVKVLLVPDDQWQAVPPHMKAITLISLIAVATAHSVTPQRISPAVRATVVLTGVTPGVTPFISELHLTINQASALTSIRFEIRPKPGSVTRPVAATYHTDYLLARGYLDPATGQIVLPVFGLYQNFTNTVTLRSSFTDGSSQQDIVNVTTPQFNDPCGYGNSIVVQARTKNTDLSYDYILVKNNCGNFSPAVLDTDGALRWVGTAGIGSLTSAFFQNGVYIANAAQIIRMELDGTFAVVGTYNNIGVTGFHHNIDYGKQGLLFEADTLSQVESLVIELDASGNVVKTWDLAAIIAAAMIAGGDDPTQFVKAAPNDWFHNNAVTYRSSDDSLIVSSREDFVICLDYTTGALRWILGDPTKKWYQFPSLRQFALALGPSTLPPIGQHAVSITQDDSLLLFDDGKGSVNNSPAGADRLYSAARKYHIDSLTKVATETWNYEAGQTLYSAFCSSVYEDAPQNYLVDYAVISNLPGGPFAELLGLNASGRKIFDYRYATVPCAMAFYSTPLHLEAMVFGTASTASPISPPKISVAVSPAKIGEGGSATYTISASTINPFQTTTVQYSLRGKAQLGTDYTVSGVFGQAEIPAGASSTTVVLQALTDVVKEKDEKSTLTLLAGPNYKLSKAKKASVAIVNAQ